MKKRLLSLLLAAVLALPLLVPVSATAEGTDPADPEISAEEYNALYVQDGLIFAADFYETNIYWRKSAVPDVNAYVWSDTAARFKFSYKEGSILEGALLMSKWEPFENVLSIEKTAELSNKAKGGTTGQYVGVFTTSGDNVFALNNLRTRVSYATVNGVRTMKVSSLGFFLSDVQKLRTEDGSILSFSAAVPASATTLTMMMTVPQFTESYYYANPDANVNNFSVTHVYDEATDSVTPRATALSKHALSFLPVKVTPAKVWDEATGSYVNNESREAYIVDAVQRDGGNANPWADFLNNQNGGENGGVSFYCQTPGHLGVYVNGLEIFDAPAYFPNNDFSAVSGTGTYLKPNQRVDTGTKLYAFRQYSRELSSGEMARNHLADLCKWFRLDISALVKNGELQLSIGDLTTVAVALSGYGFTDTPKALQAALDEAVRSVELVGEGEDFELFLTAMRAGLVEAALIRALPEALRDEAYTAFATFYRNNTDADAAACQAALDAAINTLMARDYGDYYGKTPALTADEFFADTEGLSEAALHFASVAKAFGMDMAPLVSVPDVIREHVYRSFADIHPSIPALTPILAARLDEAIEAKTDEHYAEIYLDKVLRFEGYQLRTFGGVGVRALFSVDEEIVADLEAHGYTVTLGVLLRRVNKEDFLTAYSDGKYLEDTVLLGDKPCIAYVYESYGATTMLSFLGVVKVEREGSEPLEYGTGTAGDTFGAAVKMRELANYYRETVGISAPGIQFLCQPQLSTVYVDGKNLTYAGIVNDEGAADAIAAFREVIEEKTGTTLRLLDADVTGTGHIRLVKGETAGLALRDGDFIFTYTDDLAADMAAFSAALDNTVKYAVEDGGTNKVDVVLLYAEQTFTLSEPAE